MAEVTETRVLPPEFIEAAGKTYLGDLATATGQYKGADLSKVFGQQFVAGQDPLQAPAQTLSTHGIGADTPFFKRSILQKFLQDIQPEESKLFFIKSNNTRHNIFGIWSIDLMDKLEEDLNKGERKVEVWANSIGVKIINIEFQNEDPFFNINTKEDLEKAKDRLKND